MKIPITGDLPVCHDCGAESFVIFPGTDAARFTLFPAVTLSNSFALERPVPDFALCKAHALARGWPNLACEAPKVRRAGAE